MGRSLLLILAVQVVGHSSTLTSSATAIATCADPGPVTRTVSNSSGANPAAAAATCIGTFGPSSMSTATASAQFGHLEAGGLMETSQTQASFDSRSAFMETAAVVASGAEPLIARLLFTLDAVAGEDGSFGQAVGTLYVGDVPRGSLTETAFRFPPVNFRHVQQQAFEFGILPGQPFSFGAALRSTANGTKLALVDAKLDLQLSILDLNRNPLDLPILTDVPEPHTGCMILAGGLLFVIAWFRLPLMRNLMVASCPALR